MDSASESRRPERFPAGWSFGIGTLPHPKDPIALMRICERIIKGRKENVLALAHHNADLDAVASCLIIKWLFPWVRIGSYKSISQAGRMLLSSLGESMEVDPDTGSAELLLIIDSSSPSQVSDGDISSWKEYIVIDHHQDNVNWVGNVYRDEKRSACVEIMLQMAMMSGMSLTREIAIAGMAGITADTGRFRFAKAEDMAIISFLVEGSGVSIEDVLSTIEGDEYFDISKKIAVLKSLKRVRYQRVQDQIVATSTVGSFESAAARGLLVVGCDVVFIGSQKDSEMRVSARAKPHIIRAGMNLGKFMEEVGRMIGAEGGGHDAAAGLNGKGRVDRVLETCATEFSKALRAALDKDEGTMEPEEEAQREEG
ncbi:MAG: DHHA1 domain-containing protein [Candidatus Thermoplasmatota archaeon]|nr:DHHA1 domain-containing protein [Candidatus Thermoplasmatota archaeon]